MRVLLDEDIPVGLRLYFRSEVEVETVEYRGCVTWADWNQPSRSPECLSWAGVLYPGESRKSSRAEFRRLQEKIRCRNPS